MDEKAKYCPWDESENRKRFNAHVHKLISHIDSGLVVVADGDETLSVHDTSRIFWEMNFNETAWLNFRKGFKKNGRNYKGFMDAALTYSKIDPKAYVELCEKTAARVRLRNGWGEFKAQAPTMIIVTSGIKLLWENVTKLNNWDNIYVVGGNHLGLDNFIVDQNNKVDLVKELKRSNKKVIAFGDSRLDGKMLKAANLGCIVVNNRMSPGLADCVDGLEHVYQIRMDEAPLDKVPICELSDIYDIFNIHSKKSV